MKASDTQTSVSSCIPTRRFAPSCIGRFSSHLYFLVDAYVSQWGNSCPQESFKTSLAERSKDLLEKLKKCGIGQRPVIFVGHSMGGLVAKKMLLQVTFL